MAQTGSAERKLVEGVPGFVARGEGVADLFAGEAAVFVAEHEHVEARGGGMVHEVDGGVGGVARGGYEEGCGGAKGDDGVEGPEGEGENGGGIIACKGGDGARRRKVIAACEVGADGS